MSVTLYDSRRAPNPRRVRIFLAEKGIGVATVQVDLVKREQKTDEFKKRNSLGAIPVPEPDDGECITESVAICRYFEELKPEPPLFGGDAKERARVVRKNSITRPSPVKRIHDAGRPARI